MLTTKQSKVVVALRPEFHDHTESNARGGQNMTVQSELGTRSEVKEANFQGGKEIGNNDFKVIDSFNSDKPVWYLSTLYLHSGFTQSNAKSHTSRSLFNDAGG
jgi:hypothetical protein